MPVNGYIESFNNRPLKDSPNRDHWIILFKPA